MQLRPPRSIGEVFRMFALYEKGRGLGPLLKRFDLAATSPETLASAIVGPAAATLPIQPGEDHAAYVERLLTSEAFRDALLPNSLSLLDDCRRLIFVHIPKCAGSDLEMVLASRYLPLSGDLDRAIYRPEVVFNRMHDFVLTAPFVDTVFLRGHVPLARYVDLNLVRPNDELFTVVRDPFDLIVSHVNYRLTRLLADPTGTRVDARGWLNRLHLERMPEGLSDDELLDMGRRMLHDTRMIPINTLCRMLGRGDAASAVETIRASNIEITDTARYDTWLQARWNVPKSPRANESRKILNAKTMDERDRRAIEAKTVEDRRLFDLVRDTLDRSGGASIRGRELHAPAFA